MKLSYIDFNNEHIPLGYLISFRGYGTWLHGYGAHNIRTNHVHAVVSAKCKPDMILSALKANATRATKEAGCWKRDG